MNTRVRAAREDDIELIAWVQQEAARSHLPLGLWDFAFPGPEAERLRIIARIAGARTRSSSHWSRFVVAEVEGAAAGALAGYGEPPGAAGEAWVQALWEALDAEGWSRERREAMLARLAPLWTCMPDAPGQAWVVEWAATRPGYRGRGVMGALLAAIVRRGRDLGHARVQLGVLIGNHRARRVYERAGFRVVEETRHPAFAAAVGSPGVWRMML